MSVTYGGDKITFEDGSSISSGYTHFRNRVINGDMRIDQRNAGDSVTMSTQSEPFIVDRFMVEQGGVNSNAGTAQRVVDAPDGFTYSLKYTGGSSSYNSTGFTAICQRIEGYNVSDLKWGGQNAVPVTLSFWVKSSVTGTYTVNMTHYDGAQERWNNITYTINSANTWEYKTLTFVGDTSYGIANDNGTNGWLRLYWHLGGGSGSATTTTFNSWFNGSGSKRAASGTTNIAGTTNATFQITGVQLEAGSYATSYERRPFGTELHLCQRYFQTSFNLGTKPANNVPEGQYQISLTASGDPQMVVQCVPPMRAAPSVTLYNPYFASPVAQWSNSTTNSANARAHNIGMNRFHIDNLDNSLGTGYWGISWSASAEI